MPGAVYVRHRPEKTTLYNVVRENLDTLYDAVEEGAIAIALPKFVRTELEGYLHCGFHVRPKIVSLELRKWSTEPLRKIPRHFQVLLLCAFGILRHRQVLT